MTADHTKKKTILEHADGGLRSRFARGPKKAVKSSDCRCLKRGLEHAESRFAGPLHGFNARSLFQSRCQKAMSCP